MSKTNPNQDYYKIGGRDQSDGADRAIVHEQQQETFARAEKDAKHPAMRRAKKK